MSKYQLFHLTNEQQSMLDDLSLGMTRAEIAIARGYSVSTVFSYIELIKREFMCRNDNQLVAVWVDSRRG